MNVRRFLLVPAAALCALAVLTEAAAAQESLRGLSLEELLAVEVSTVTRTPEPAFLSPAATHVITADDIRRSGVTSLAEALRLAPGVQVARIDAGKWAIGIRGFADRLARSTLVLIDGRAVYSPLFAGTYWEVQDMLLDDIERIEVIRGPGGTLWGSNAVNGIINIVTRPAGDTQGVLATVAAGPEEVAGALRYGGRLGEAGFARGYVKAFRVEPQFHTGELAYDGWRLGQAGFRSDWRLPRGQTLMVQGDLHQARVGEFVRVTSLTPPFSQTSTVDLPLSGGSVLARWTRPVGAGLVQLQGYYARTAREEYPISETRDTVDVDFQQRLPTWGRHDLLWGAAFRNSRGELTTAPTAELPDGSERLFSAFVQDEVSSPSGDVRLTLGAKLEHNPYSGAELQPGVRLLWLPDSASVVWGAVTRAVRRPTRVEREYTTTSVFNPAVPAFLRLLPNPDFAPERLTAYEAGYRVRPHPNVYVTVSAFFNQLNDLLSVEIVAPPAVESTPPPARLVLPLTFGNGLDGNSHGLEATADVRPAAWWRVTGHYALLRVQVTPGPGSADATQEANYEDGSPTHQALVRNAFRLAPDVSLDWNLRYVSALPVSGIPAYATADVRLAWQVNDGLELEAVARNLPQAHHREWEGHNGGADVAIERAMYVGLTWRR